MLFYPHGTRLPELSATGQPRDEEDGQRYLDCPLMLAQILTGRHS